MPPTPTIPVEHIARWVHARQRRDETSVLRVRVERDGAVLYQLTVNPPHLDGTARRRLHAWQAWPRLGAVGGLGIGGVVAALTGSTTGFLVGAAFYLLGTVVLASRAQPQRQAVRRLRAIDVGPTTTDAELLQCGRLLHLPRVLVDADRARQDGRAATAADHLRVWDRVYREMGRS